MEGSIGPWFGFDTKDSKYEAVGSKDVRVSFTGLDDVGKVVTSLASMPVEKVLDEIHISGNSASISEIAEIMDGAGREG